MQQSKNKIRVLGLMSGTSMDGLDLALVEFFRQENRWAYTLVAAETLKYPQGWQKKLLTAPELPAVALLDLHHAYGDYLGNQCLQFMQRFGSVDLIASHGHTIFHQPEQGFTFQLGDANALHAQVNLPVVADFRSLDVALGGQGAPLVPVADEGLFGEYEICLNFGGIANLSFVEAGHRKAYDIVFCNLLLNFLAEKKGKPLDKNGRWAAEGSVNPELLKKLNQQQARLRKSRPSLSREILVKSFLPLFRNKRNINDSLATVCEFIAQEIATVLIATGGGQVLCTGGGAFNSYLISLLAEKSNDQFTLILPEDELIKFKEAIAFAYLGLLRMSGEINALSSVTGASRDSSGGVLIM